MPSKAAPAPPQSRKRTKDAAPQQQSSSSSSAAAASETTPADATTTSATTPPARNGPQTTVGKVQTRGSSLTRFVRRFMTPPTGDLLTAPSADALAQRLQAYEAQLYQRRPVAERNQRDAPAASTPAQQQQRNESP